jgi:hypothetical protein
VDMRIDDAIGALWLRDGLLQHLIEVWLCRTSPPFSHESRLLTKSLGFSQDAARPLKKIKAGQGLARICIGVQRVDKEGGK